MIDKLRALSPAELETMAGEILRSLSASGAKHPKASVPDGMFFPPAQRPASEEAPLSARPAAETDSVPQVQETASPERFGTYALPLREERGVFSALSAPAVQMQDAEALSDFFRRDSRRYDGGFERY